MFIVSIIKYVTVNEEHADDLAFFNSFATSRDKTLHFVLRLVIEGKQYNL